MPSDPSGGAALPPAAQRVLKFSAESSGTDGLRYEDYMGALQGGLRGLDVTSLSSALHQLESAGLLVPDPVGTPNRRIRLTPKGREATLGNAAAPTPAEAAQEAADPSAPRLKSKDGGGDAQGSSPKASSSGGSSPPAPAPRKEGIMADERTQLSEQRDEESRKRLKLVIDREDAVRASEEKLRSEEKRLLEEEERLAESRRGLEKEKSDHATKVEDHRKAVETDKSNLENERKQLANAGQALQRFRFELEQQDQKIKKDNQALDERSHATNAKEKELGEREKVVTDSEDALHAHLQTVKDHMASARQSEEGITKVHAAVSASRERRGKPSSG